MQRVRTLATKYAPGVDVKFYRFSSDLREDRPDNAAPPAATSRSLGTALVEAAKRQSGKKLLGEVILTDGKNNGGLPPLIAAGQLKG